MTECVLAGGLLLGSEILEGSVRVDGGRIAAIERGRSGVSSDIPTFRGDIVAPGYIDLQVNGGFGCAVEDGPGALQVLAGRLPETGVTAFLPTVITATLPTYEAAFAALRDCRITGAETRPLGWHLEGPVLSPQRAGAHRPEYMVDGDASIVDTLLAEPNVRMMTVAPERPAALRLIERLRSRGVVVSLGHTDAGIEEFRRGGDAGATMATHIFNAMSPFEHRLPNAAGGALLDDRLASGLIADGIHCHAAALELVLRAKGVDHIALVTDMVAAAGMPDGRYRIGDQIVDAQRGVVRRSDGTLAGSALLMDQAVRYMIATTSATTAEVLRMASEVPARILGLSDVGVLRVGARADLVLLDRDLKVQRTMIGGEWAYQAASV